MRPSVVRWRVRVALALAAWGLPAPARAQPATAQAPAPAVRCEKLVCAPTLAFQPGVMVVNALDARVVTARGDRAAAQTTPLVRVATSAPTRWSRTALVAAVWYTPFLTTATRDPASGVVTGEVSANAPSFLVGANFTVLLLGPVAAQVAVVDGYRRYEARDEDGTLDQYRHNLIVAPSVNLRFAGLLAATAPRALRAITAYGIWQQQLTNLPYHIGTDARPTTDRTYAPGLFFGLSVPIAPTP